MAAFIQIHPLSSGPSLSVQYVREAYSMEIEKWNSGTLANCREENLAH
jgi:hypothetical protein